MKRRLGLPVDDVLAGTDTRDIFEFGPAGTLDFGGGQVGLFGRTNTRFPQKSLTVLDDCSSASSWTKSGASSSATDDTSDIGGFGSAIKYVTDGAGAGNTLTKSITSTDFTGGGALVLALKIDDYSNYSDFQVRLGSGGDTTTNYVYCQPLYTSATQRWIGAGEWKPITIPMGAKAFTSDGQFKTQGTGATMSAINAIKFKNVDLGTGGKQTVRIGGIWLMAAPSNHCVSLCFDDSRRSHFTVAKKKMDTYGFAGTSFVIAEGVLSADSGASSAYMTSAQLRNLRDISGWEIEAHAFSNVQGHQAHSLGYDAILSDNAEFDIQRLKAWLRYNGFHGNHLALPHGTFNTGGVNPNVDRQVRAYFDTARVTYLNTVETYPPADTHRLRSYVVTSSDTASTLDAAVALAATNRWWLILTFHDLVSSPSNSTDFSITEFNTFIDDLHTNSRNVKPLGQVLRSGV